MTYKICTLKEVLCGNRDLGAHQYGMAWEMAILGAVALKLVVRLARQYLNIEALKYIYYKYIYC